MDVKTQQAYTFTAHPHPVTGREKYRPDSKLENAETVVFANLMNDPRVRRGPTLGRPTLASTMVAPEDRRSAVREEIEAHKERKRHLIATGRIRPPMKTAHELHENIVVVKQREEIPLHLYLEEQEEKPLTMDAQTETDTFVEAPAPAPYIPVKRGVDAAVQVETDMVFNFDREVQPLLEVLVSKVLEQALVEVSQEEEMRNLRSHRTELDAKAASDAEAERRREEEERRLYSEMEARRLGAKQQASHAKLVRQKLEAGVFAQDFLRGLEGAVVQRLEQRGFLHDAVRRQVEHEFLPSVLQQVAVHLANHTAAGRMVEDLVSTAVARLQLQAKEAHDKRKAEEERQRAEEEQRRKEAEEAAFRAQRVALFIHSNLNSEGPVGPIRLPLESTVAKVEEKVMAWMDKHLEEEERPSRDRIRFLFNGDELDKGRMLLDIGLENLGQITMHIEPPPPDEKEGDEEGDENEGAEEAGDSDAEDEEV